MRILDFNKSFIYSQSPGPNRVRFWVESWTQIIEQASGRSIDLYQCGSCKSEVMWLKTGLFQDDNYDFLPIFGPNGSTVFRRRAWLNPNYRTFTPYAAGTSWAKPIYGLHDAPAFEELSDEATIRSATERGLPLIAQTQIQDAKRGLLVRVQYPVKTMNIEVDRSCYQIDTGPVALLAPAGEQADPEQDICLAFVAFNRADHAEFVIETPTALQNGESVHHYSQLIASPATNRLFAINDTMMGSK